MTPSQLRARYRRIVLFFARVVAGFIWWELILPKIGLGGVSKRTRTERNRKIAVRFRALAIKMGGLMIKVGQFLSARFDVLPAEITEELAGLQDEVPAESWDAIRACAESQLGQQLDVHFAWIDEQPLAAASLGQVHRAHLHESDAQAVGFTDVVVKVQRPHIEQIIEVDLAALRRVGTWLARYKPVSDRADVKALIEEFASTTTEEIDYLAEGHNAETFAANFAANPRIHIPRVVWSLSALRVLTLEDVSAIKLSDNAGIVTAGINPNDVATLLLESYMQQIFDDGFFHGDPHPGNLFVTPLEGLDENGAQNWQLTFVDFGMVGRVPDNLRTGLREVILAVGTQDSPRLVGAFNMLGVLLPSADLKLIERAATQVFDRFWGMSMDDLRSISPDEMLNFGLQFKELITAMPFQLPENLLLLGRTVAILSGICTGLDSEFNMWQAVSPYATKLISDEGGKDWKMWLGEITKVLGTLVGLPGRVDRVMATMERSELSVQTPLLNLRVRRVEKSINRLSGGVVFAALLVAGAILYPESQMLAKMLMGGSAVVLAWMLFGGRGHGGRL